MITLHVGSLGKPDPVFQKMVIIERMLDQGFYDERPTSNSPLAFAFLTLYK